MSYIVAPTDDYEEAEYLDDQVSTSSGQVLYFGFLADVNKVWVEFSSSDEDAEARARADGEDPDADTGTPLHVNQAQPISLTTSQVAVYVPTAGCTVKVYGYRREAAELVEGATVLRKATVTATSAELLDLVANPKTIIAAPGAGKAIFPVSILHDFEYVTATYAGAASVFLGIGSSIANVSDLTSMVKSTASKIAPDTMSGSDLRSAAENTAMTLQNIGADLTTGDGTLTITVLYEVVTLS